MTMTTWQFVVTALLAGFAVGCGGDGDKATETPPAAAAASVLIIRDTTIVATFDAVGLAEPVQQATLSTKLMGSVTAVLVREGARVTEGQTLARIDARDIDARQTQVEAGVAAADAVYQDALAQARRIRALYADSVATRYQLEQVETGLARAESGLRAAQASRAELDAVNDYATIRSPFAGVVTQRFVDPGAFAAPGTPVVTVMDASRLRVSVTIPTNVAAGLKPGHAIDGEIDGRPVRATIEGVVPSPAGGVYTVNAMVSNRRNEFLPGSSATLHVPAGQRVAVLVPEVALVREGDLTGVRIAGASGAELRWVKVGGAVGDRVEVLAGLRPGDVVHLRSE